MKTLERYEKIKSDFWEMQDILGKKGDMFKDHIAETYADGVFDQKTKRLMALSGALAAGCEGCIMGQTIKALDLGATKEEILEVCAIAVSLGGTMGGTRTALVYQILKEKGLA